MNVEAQQLVEKMLVTGVPSVPQHVMINPRKSNNSSNKKRLLTMVNGQVFDAVNY